MYVPVISAIASLCQVEAPQDECTHYLSCTSNRRLTDYPIPCPTSCPKTPKKKKASKKSSLSVFLTTLSFSLSLSFSRA